jgi:hypothetical protein
MRTDSEYWSQAYTLVVLVIIVFVPNVSVETQI